MSFFNWLKSKSETRDAEVAPAEVGGPKEIRRVPVDESNEAPEATGNLILEENSLAGVVEGPATGLPPGESATTSSLPTISVPLSAFLDKLPKELLVTHIPDLNRTVQIAEEDLIVEGSDGVAAVALSILSLSCPEIFLKPIGRENDEPIRFSLNSIPPAPVQEPTHLRIGVRSIILDFPPDLETPEIREAIESMASIELPLALVKPQLEAGRVTVTAATLRELLPLDLKERFHGIEADIPISLQEIFKNLPCGVIRRRNDQEIEVAEAAIATPFTLQAREDAARFDPALALEPLPETLPPLDVPPEPKVTLSPVAGQPVPSVRALTSERLQAVFMTDEILDLNGVIKQVGKLPGLRGCLLSHRDGKKISGDLGDLEREPAISTLLPTLFQDISNKFSELQLGELETLTFCSRKEQLSTFLQGEYCLTVRHEGRPFKPGVREKIQTVMSEISETQGS